MTGHDPWDRLPTVLDRVTTSILAGAERLRKS